MKSKGKRNFKDPKIANVVLFHNLAKEYKWDFDKIEEVLGIPMLVSKDELPYYIQGIFKGEARYSRSTK